MYRVILYFWRRGIKRHPHQSENTVQSPKSVSMSGSVENCGSTLKQDWVYATEGIHVEDIVLLALSLIISWTFRILAHEKDQYTVMFRKYQADYTPPRV